MMMALVQASSSQRINSLLTNIIRVGNENMPRTWRLVNFSKVTFLPKRLTVYTCTRKAWDNLLRKRSHIVSVRLLRWRVLSDFHHNFFKLQSLHHLEEFADVCHFTADPVIKLNQKQYQMNEKKNPPKQQTRIKL